MHQRLQHTILIDNEAVLKVLYLFIYLSEKILTLFYSVFDSCLYFFKKMYMGNDADQKEKYGEKVTYLKAALDKINEALKILKVGKKNYIAVR